jgi:MarR family transcriptional regulator for hemolysin
MTDLEERFSKALNHTSRAWRRALDVRLKNLGVGQAGWRALSQVAKAGSPLSQTNLADQLAIEGSSMATMLDRLVAAGLLTRARSAADRRIKLILMTTRGCSLFAQLCAEAELFRTSTLSDIDFQALGAATALLELICQHIDSELKIVRSSAPSK